MSNTDYTDMNLSRQPSNKHLPHSFSVLAIILICILKDGVAGDSLPSLSPDISILSSKPIIPNHEALNESLDSCTVCRSLVKSFDRVSTPVY